jgi:hypothetical protein
MGIALVVVSWAGCRFDWPRVETVTDGDVIPDASICENLDKSCVTPTVLRDCQTVGQLPVDTTCSWGCLEGVSPPLCGKLQPAGGVLTELDLAPDARLLEIMATAGGEINTDDGSITNVRAMGIGVKDGIDYERRDVTIPGGGTRMIGVFRFGKLTLMGNWTVRGQHALAIASLGEVVIAGPLDLRGDCVGGDAGPGGTAGAVDDAAEPGGGNGGAESGGDSSGGGGGGHGADGGNGGRIAGAGAGTAPGVAWGDAMIAALVGGGGGGGGGGASDGIGGGGGGAVQIAANGKVSIRIAGATSGINAGGCGGKGGADGGGGGGAGGTILIEAPSVELDGTYLVVNGGGGGGGGNTSAAGNGASGGWASTPAAGGLKGGGPDGSGGTGGAAGSLKGQNGQDTVNTGGTDSGGGGGGGVGRIRILTRLPDGVTLTAGSVVSPTFDETGSTATKDVATVR